MQRSEDFLGVPEQTLKTDIPVQSPSGLQVLLRPSDVDVRGVKPSGIAVHRHDVDRKVVLVGDLCLVTFVLPVAARSVEICFSSLFDFSREDEIREKITADKLSAEDRTFTLMFVGESKDGKQPSKTLTCSFNSVEQWQKFSEFPVRFFHVSTNAIGSVQVDQVRWED